VKWLIPFILTSTLIFGSQSADSLLVEKSPGKAVLYSLIPGGGQVYNGKYIKAIILFSVEVYFIYQFQKNLVAYNEWDSGNYPLPKHRYRGKRNKYAWWIGFTYIYNLIDSLVDSHLATFDFDIFEEEKPGDNNEPPIEEE